MGVACRPRCYPGCRRGRALGRRPPAAGTGRVGKRCRLRAGGVGPWHRSADPGRGGENIEEQKDLLRERGMQVPATAGTTPMARQLLRYVPALQVAGIVLGVRSGLRNPRRLTVLAIASEALATWSYVLRVPRAVQRRRPRMAAGSALVVAGSVARLRAAAVEPLR